MQEIEGRLEPGAGLRAVAAAGRRGRRDQLAREGVLVETVDVTDVDGDRLDDVVAVAQGQEIGRQVVVNGAPACRSR